MEQMELNGTSSEECCGGKACGETEMKEQGTVGSMVSSEPMTMERLMAAVIDLSTLINRVQMEMGSFANAVQENMGSMYKSITDEISALKKDCTKQ